MTDWMTLRVELLGRGDESLQPAPGRVLLVHADHTFAELADAIDAAFGRWDLTPLHEFTLEGRRLLAGGDPDDPGADDSEVMPLRDAALGDGTSFRYVFDLGERWLHECRVEEVDVEVDDPVDVPVPVFGWGTIPDQYGRESDEDDADGGVVDWTTVAEALHDWDRPAPLGDLEAAAGRLRTEAEVGLPPYDVLLAAAGLEATTLPADDEALWVAAAAGTVAPRTSASLDAAAEAVWSTLEPADWAGLLIGLVRGDVGQSAEPEVLAHLIATCPEVQAEPLVGEDREAVLDALETVTGWWQALCAIDDDRRLTALGRWGLPRALREAWAVPADDLA